MSERIYFDWNATTPPLEEVVARMGEVARTAWANPASIHGDGRQARSVVEAARHAVAELAGADPRDVLFTSGGTEANNLALRSALTGGGALVTSRLEHPSITRVAEALEREGKARVRWLRVTSEGRIDLGDLEQALAEPDTTALALQAVNHETGAIQPVSEAVALARSVGRHVHVHLDMVQAFGKTCGSGAASFPEADTRALAAHKIRGPKGIGALVTRPRTRLDPLLFGGAQERGLRPGTVDPVAAAGFERAAAHARDGASRLIRAAAMRDCLERELAKTYSFLELLGSPPRAPHVASLAWHGWEGPALVAALDLEGLSVSSGSACSAGTSEPSAVIRAMRGEAVAQATIRISLGETTSEDEIDRALRIFRRVLARGRRPV